MGVLTDLFIATQEEVLALDRETSPYKVFPYVDIKGIDFIMLGSLQAILAHQPYEDSHILGFISVDEPDDDGPWITTTPAELRNLLAGLTEPQIPDIAAQWITTEEFTVLPGRVDLQIIIERLGEMVALARQAVSDNKSLYMWICL